MVKTPRTRHSSTGKDPVTIDLQPGEVSRVKAEAEAKEAAAVSGAAEEAARRPAADELQGADATVPEQDASASTPDPAREGTGPSVESETADRQEPSGTFSETFDPDASSDPRPDETADEASPGAAASSASAFGRAERSMPSSRPAQSRGTVLAAGVAGGVIALLLAAGLQMAGILPGAADRSADAAAIAGLETRIAQLDQQVGALGDGSALEGRIDRAEERLSETEGALQTVRDEIASLPAGSGGDLAAIDERISGIEKAIAAFGGSTAPADALAAVDEQITTIRQELSEVRDGASESTARLGTLEQSLSDLAARVEDNAGGPAAAAVIAASALNAAIDRGSPFVTELDTYASVAPGAPAVEQLRQFAEAGVPTLAQLAGEADAAADAMIAASRPVDPQAGVVDRLWTSARGLVRVRPVGMVEGDGVPETAARIDAAVKAGDLERALAEYGSLPEASKTAGAAFMAKVQARHTADRLSDEALAAALRD